MNTFNVSTDSKLYSQMVELGVKAKNASSILANLSCEQKNKCLIAMADAILANKEAIEQANRLDIEDAQKAGLSAAMLDRLTLTPKRIEAMAKGVKEVANLPDPLGKELDSRQRPNGLKLRKVTCPIGVIVIIFESRPNVTADAAALCFKSGNVTILRGGKEALRSNLMIADIMVKAARKIYHDFPLEAIQVVPTTDRQAIPMLLSLTEFIDLCIPRGGEGLIRTVMSCSHVPVIKHYKGVCHVYVNEDADIEMAKRIIINAKVQRPSACNAAETLLIDEKIAKQALPTLASALMEQGVKLHCDRNSLDILKSELPSETAMDLIVPIDKEEWAKEYLDLILSVGVVKNESEAIAHINRYGSRHTECIITESKEKAMRFQHEVDAAVVCWNASTRFNDGGEFGMGAEIGISTDKVGPRGPMGLDQLTTYKWMVDGNGQVRA